MSGWAHAFSLSKAAVADSEPPGTVRLIEHDLHRTVSGNEQTKDHITLVPTPTDSPADPLNWSNPRRYGILAALSFYAFAADFGTAVVAPALPVMAYAIYPPESFPQLTKLISFNVLLFGISNILWVPLSNIFGRRPILLISSLVFTLASMWCGLAPSFASLLGARILQGFGGGTSYAIAPDMLGELFFVHERGRAMAVYTAALAAGPFVGGISGGYLAGSYGYQYIFWVSTALAAFSFLLILLVVPETLFDRNSHLAERVNRAVDGVHSGTEKAAVSSYEHETTSRSRPETRYMQNMGFFNVYRGDWVHHFLRPWLTLVFPGTWMVMLQYGSLVGAVVGIATMGSQFLAAPPYLWGNNVGLINLGGLIGAILGGLFVFLTADYLIKWRAKKEVHGLSEPETRLPLMLPGVFLAATGTWTFGFCAANPSPHAWAGLLVGSGMHAAGLTMVPSIGFNYLIEAYYAVSGDCFVMVIILRSVISFAWTYFIVEWCVKAGPGLPFGIFGLLIAVFGLLAIPVQMYGKRGRIATARWLPERADH